MPDDHSSWERGVLERLAMQSLKEQRARRRWGIFFKLVTVAFVALFLFAALGWIGNYEQPCINRCTALVNVEGVIDSDAPASAENVIQGLQSAMENTSVKGIVLRINSPGGSAVQAGMVNDELRRLRAKHPDRPIYAVVEEMAASAAYYIAVGAERIYVDKASLVGSIGVLIDGFGFTGTMDKLGVERRLITAGTDKAFLDPFSPMSDKHREYAQQMIDEIHEQFIEVVRQGRKDKLKETPDLFTGLVWNGQRGVELGLADGLGSVNYVAREVIKAEDVVDFTPHRSLTERLVKRFGAAFGQALGMTLLQSRWSIR